MMNKKIFPEANEYNIMLIFEIYSSIEVKVL